METYKDEKCHENHNEYYTHVSFSNGNPLQVNAILTRYNATERSTQVHSNNRNQLANLALG